MTTKYLFGAEADSIQSTLFRAERQRQVVGGSRLLDDFCAQVGELAHAYGADPNDVLIKAGGNFRIQFPLDKEKEADKFAEQLTNAYRLLLDASITVAPLVEVNGDFSQQNELLTKNIQRGKRSQRGAADTPHAPSTAFCQASGVGLATDYDIVTQAELKTEQYLSTFAQNMNKAGKKEYDSENDFLRKIIERMDSDSPYRTWPWGDIEDIAGLDGERRNVAYLVADGNNMGKLFGKCNAKQLKTLSDHLEKAIRQALVATRVTDETTVEAPVIALAKQLEAAGKYNQNGEEDHFLPLLPLILAGDDVFILLPAVYALDFAHRFCLAFEHFMMQSAVVGELCAAGSPPPTIAAAVVFCKSSYPYHLAHRRGEELLGQAKKLIKSVGLSPETGEWHSALAFDFIVGSELVGDEKESEKGVYRSTISPYWVTETSLGEDAQKAALSLDSWLVHRWLLHVLPHKRLAQIRELFAPENLPDKTKDLQRWNARLDRLRRQITAGNPENRQILAFEQALYDLGNRSEDKGGNPGHWRSVSRPGESPFQAHGLPELISVWPYAQSLDYSLDDYEEEGR